MIVCGGLVSMRKSALKIFGGELHSLWDTPRMDSGRRSRSASHVCRKDWQASSRRDYKPWQTSEVIGLAEAMASNDQQLMDWQDFCDEDYVLTEKDMFQPDAEYIRQTYQEEMTTMPVGWDEDTMYWNGEEAGWDEQQESYVAYDYHRAAGIVAGEIEADAIDSWLFDYIPCYQASDYDESYSDSMNDPSYFSDDSDDSSWWCPKPPKYSPAAKNARELYLSEEEYQALCEPCLEDVLRF